MISRCYLEIINTCNLHCKFCPKTTRRKHIMSIEEFENLTDKLRNEVKFLYFHLMGEPLLHPRLSEFISIAHNKGFVPIITTNGTLLNHQESLINAKPYKIQISLQAHEGNTSESPYEYIYNVVQFALKAAKSGIIIILRLWNEGGAETLNKQITETIQALIPTQWKERHDGWKINDNLFIEFDKVFEWPNIDTKPIEDNSLFCHALRNQIGVLVDGTVVPCCLDHNGDINLGNLHQATLAEILNSQRAKNIYNGFSNHTAIEELCQRCGYAKVKNYRNSEKNNNL